MLDRGMARVRANDFATQWEEIGADALAAVDRVRRSGWLVLGEEVSAFETELAAWWGVPHAVGVASGLDALEIALRCCEVGPGDRVLTTPLTAFATTLAIVRAGAQPVWSDVDASGSLDLEQVAAALEADPGIRAVLPVHLYGHPLDPAALAALAESFGVVVIEDCAQSTGAHRDERPTGTVGRMAATSLYPTKNLGALGDGGVLSPPTMSSRPGPADRATTVRALNTSMWSSGSIAGSTSCTPRCLGCAAAATRRLARAPSGGRRTLRRGTRGLRAAAGSTDRGRLRQSPLPGARDQGRGPRGSAGRPRRRVSAGQHYPTLCPDQPAAASLGASVGSLRVASRIAEGELSLPIHPQLEDREVDRVIDVCRSVMG